MSDCIVEFHLAHEVEVKQRCAQWDSNNTYSDILGSVEKDMSACCVENTVGYD